MRRLFLILPAIAAVALVVIFLGPAVLVFLQSPETEVADARLDDDRSWFSRQLDRFRSYPFEDRALRLEREGRFAEAEDALKAAGRADPGDPRIHIALADLAAKQSNSAAARDHALAALAIAPDLAPARLRLAMARQALGDNSGAFDDFMAALDGHGLDDAQRTLAERGFIETGLRIGRAEAVAARAGDFGTADWRSILLALADSAAASGDYAEARRRLEQANDIGGGPDIPRRLAALAENDGDLAAAIRWASQAVEATDSPLDLRRLARLQAKAGRFDEAAGSYERLADRMALDPDDLEIWANALSENGRPAEAAGILARLPFAEALAERRANLLADAGDPGAAADLLLAAAAKAEPPERLKLLRAAAERLRAAGALERELATRTAIAEASGADSDLLALADRQVGAGRPRAAAETLRPRALAGASPFLDRYADAVAAGLPADEAARRMRALYRANALTRKQRAAVSARLAALTAANGDWPTIARLRAARARARPADTGALDDALFAFRQAGDAAGELDLLGQMAPFARMTPDARTRFAERLGDLVAAKSGPRAGAEAFADAAGGRDAPPAVQLALAERFVAASACDMATVAAERAALAPALSPRAYEIAGRCAIARGGRQSAFAYLQKSVDAADALGADVPADLLIEVALLHAEAGAHGPAASAFERALEQRFDAGDAVLAGRSLRLAGDTEAARARLAAIDPAAIAAPGRRALYFDETAHLAPDAEGARSALMQAVALEETADRWQRLAFLNRDAGRLDDAGADMDRALALAPDSANMHAARAYLAVAAGDDDLAGAHFETALTQDPSLPAAQDAAYAHKRRAANDLAVRRFQDAIDGVDRRLDGIAAGAPESADELDALQNLRFDLRREVEEIENRWTISANLTFRTPDDAFGAANPVQTDSFSGFGGVEVAYQPPTVGYRNGRTLQAFVRGFWSLEDDSLAPDADTRQLGVGLRYKPLTDWNAVLSFERLVALGDLASDDWLARASISFDQNLDWEPTRDWWPTGTLFLDVAHELEDETTFLTATGRYGVSFRPGFGEDWAWAQAFMVYGVADATYVSDDGEDQKRVEIGAGLAWRHWFNETRYEAYRSTGEIAVEGRAPIAGNTGDKAGVLLRLSLQY